MPPGFPFGAPVSHAAEPCRWSDCRCDRIDLVLELGLAVGSTDWILRADIRWSPRRPSQSTHLHLPLKSSAATARSELSQPSMTRVLDSFQISLASPWPGFPHSAVPASYKNLDVAFSPFALPVRSNPAFRCFWQLSLRETADRFVRYTRGRAGLKAFRCD